ncbi:hypothetical protein HDV05_006125 [Chytridiales sp. JEL 0842]|nr:hypothetical protein HDV05_006125 [Chytridiales sp. JEL 0842]
MIGSKLAHPRIFRAPSTWRTALTPKTPHRSFLLRGHRPVVTNTSSTANSTEQQQHDKVTTTSPQHQQHSPTSFTGPTPSGFMSPFFANDPFFRDIDRLFDIQRRSLDNLFPSLFSPARNIPSVWGPSQVSPAFAKVDLTEHEKEYILHVDLPGVKKDEVQISVKDGILTLQGSRTVEKTEENKEEGKKHFVERSSGSFERRLMLPEDVDLEADVQAKMEDGVLEMRFVKKAEEKMGVKKISVQ